MTKFFAVLGVIVLVLALLVGISAGLGFLTMFVWNAIVPAFGGPTIGFYVAWGLWFLVGALTSRLRPLRDTKEDQESRQEQLRKLLG